LYFCKINHLKKRFMKKIYAITFIVVMNVMLFNVCAQSNASDNASAVSVSVVKAAADIQVETGTWFYNNKSTLLYDNGPLVTNPGFGGAADTSLLETGLGLNTLGAGHAQSTGYRVADEVVLATGCTVDSIAFFAYQTGSTTTSTMTGYNLRIYDGVPGAPGTNLVWGDSLTNIMGSTAWSNIYRMSDTSPGTTRPIMISYAVTTGLHLNPGTYWLDWQAAGSLASGPWAPPVAILGQTTTGNAKQWNLTAWGDLTDSGTLTGLGLPFIMYGTWDGASSNDVGVSALVSPVSGALTAAETVEVTVENFGTTDQTGFSVSFQIDGGTVETQTFSGTVTGGNTQNFSFTGTFDFSAAGPIDVIAWTGLVGDEDNSNDTLEVTVNNTSGIEGFNAQSIQIYPNPAVYPVKVSANVEVTLVEVYDMTGRLVVSDQPMRNEFFISFDKFEQGIYTIVLQSELGTYTSKIIKN
jgi:hypothetical protein